MRSTSSRLATGWVLAAGLAVAVGCAKPPAGTAGAGPGQAPSGGLSRGHSGSTAWATQRASDDAAARGESGSATAARAHVLFVHGHGADPWRFDPMRQSLERDGYRTYTLEFPGMEEDMDWLAWWVRGKVAAIKREHQVPAVDLVAHSMGGLISRYYLRYLDGDKHVRRLITLATPHHGIHLARVPFFPRFLISENLRRQVIPGSPLLNKLNEGDETPGDRVLYTSIGSHDDAYISVKSSFLAGANNYVIKGPTHTTIMSDPVPIGLVKGALAEVSRP